MPRKRKEEVTIEPGKGLNLRRPIEFALNRLPRWSSRWCISTYNHEQPYIALKYKTPDAMHRAFYCLDTVNLFQSFKIFQ